MRRFYIVFVGCLLFVLPVHAEVKPRSSALLTPCKLSSEQAMISLPPVKFKGLTVEQALQNRRSERRFGNEPLSLQQLSQLLWAAQGITRPETGQRTAPSSARSYPIDLYVSLQKVAGVKCGLYRYLPESHSMKRVHAADYAAALAVVANNQPWVRNAAAVILHVATPARAARKYGAKTAVPSSLIEAGHISQNIYLQATSIGLAVLGMNGFSQSQIDHLLGLKSGQTTLFMNLVGVRSGL